LEEIMIPSDVISAIPESLAIKHCLVPIFKKDKKITVAMADPLNVFAIEDIKMTTGLDVDPAIASETEIKAVHARYYGSAGQAASTAAATPEAPTVNMDDILTSMDNAHQSLEVVEEAEDDMDISSLEAAGEDAPVVRLVNLLLTE